MKNKNIEDYEIRKIFKIDYVATTKMNMSEPKDTFSTRRGSYTIYIYEQGDLVYTLKHLVHIGDYEMRKSVKRPDVRSSYSTVAYRGNFEGLMNYMKKEFGSIYRDNKLNEIFRK